MALNIEINNIILKIIAKSNGSECFISYNQNTITKINQYNVFFPASIESIPRLGPTVLSSRILIGAGREPALRRTAKSLAVSGKVTTIFPWPPVIVSI